MRDAALSGRTIGGSVAAWANRAFPAARVPSAIELAPARATAAALPAPLPNARRLSLARWVNSRGLVTKRQVSESTWPSRCMVLTVAALTIGCSHMAGQAATEATEQALAAVANEEENLANIEKILASPEMQASVEALAGALARGLVDGLIGPEAQARRGDNGAEQVLREQIEPAVASMMRTVVAATMDEVLATRRREAVHEGAAGLTATVIDTTMSELGEGLEEDLAPALARSMNEHLGPALLERLDDAELRAAAGLVAHELAYQVVLGTNAGVAELAARQPAAEESVLTKLGQYFSIGSVALAIALLTILVLLIRNARQRRILADLAQQRESTLVSLIQAMTLRDASPEERRELVELLRSINEGPSGGHTEEA